jgi:hypothetical protein
MKQYMCWIYHVATTIASKCPPNLLTQSSTMVYMVVYLVKAYYIMPTLVVNND